MGFALRAFQWLQRYSLDVAASGSCAGAFAVVLTQAPSPSGWVLLPFIGTVLGVYWLERALEPLPAEQKLPTRLHWKPLRRTRLALWSVGFLAAVSLWLVSHPVSYRLHWVVAAGLMVGLRWGCVQIATLHPQVQIAAMLIRCTATALGYLAGGVAFFAPSLAVGNLLSLVPLLASILVSVLIQDLCDAETDQALGRANLTAGWSAQGVLYRMLLPILALGMGFALFRVHLGPEKVGLLTLLVVQAGLALRFAVGTPSPMQRTRTRIAAEWVLCLPYLFWVISRWA